VFLEAGRVIVPDFERRTESDRMLGSLLSVWFPGRVIAKVLMTFLCNVLVGAWSQAYADQSSPAPLMPAQTAHEPPMFAGYRMLDTVVVTGKIHDEDGHPDGLRQSYVSTCYVLAWIRHTGKIHAGQIVRSSGIPRLNDACLKATLGQRMVPATRNGVPVDAWAVIPIEWRLTTKTPATPAASTADEPIATIAPNQILNLDSVPDTATPAKDPICIAHVLVSEMGNPDQITVTRSTGSQTFDKLCMDAIRPITFIPAQRGGHALTAAVDVWIELSADDAASSAAQVVAPPAPAPSVKVQPSPQLLQTIQSKATSLAAQRAAGSSTHVDCLLSLWYTGDGIVLAAQMLRATDFRLSIRRACTWC